MCLCVWIVEFDAGCLSHLFFTIHTEAGSLTLKSELTSSASLLAHLPWGTLFSPPVLDFSCPPPPSTPTLHLHECWSLNSYLHS